jgi:hypothetical protein
MSSSIECEGYYTRKLDDGRGLTVYRTIFGNGRLCIGDGFFLKVRGAIRFFSIHCLQWKSGTPGKGVRPPVSPALKSRP